MKPTIAPPAAADARRSISNCGPAGIISFGIDYRLDRLVIQARDFDGPPLVDQHLPITEMANVDQIVVRLAGLIDDVTKEVGYMPSGIGMSLPATVTPDRTGVITSHYSILDNAPFATLLRKAVGPGCPSILLGDVASCAAIANWRDIPKQAQAIWCMCRSASVPALDTSRGTFQ